MKFSEEILPFLLVAIVIALIAYCATRPEPPKEYYYVPDESKRAAIVQDLADKIHVTTQEAKEMIEFNLRHKDD
jgi:hypothetical protein